MWSRPRIIRCLLLVVVAWLAAALGAPGPTRAHGTLHDQIADLDRRIVQYPDHAELYLRRGDLHRRHLDWAKSLADLDRAAGLEPSNIEVCYLRGKTYLDSDRLREAEAAFERYLEQLPGEPALHDRRASALLLLGKALRQLGRQLEAAGSYRRAVDLADRPGHQAFLDCARAFEAAGDAHLEAALRCLDDGLERLGNVVSLAYPAIDLEFRRGYFDGALERLDRLAALSPRKESWLVQRGEILERTGRTAEARETLLAARAAIEQLPATCRRSRSTHDLETRIAEVLARLESPSSRPPDGPKR